MRFLDATGDFYLRKGMDLERQRDNLLESYKRSKNPKTAELLRRITEECNAVWLTVKLMDFNKFRYQRS